MYIKDFQGFVKTQCDVYAGMANNAGLSGACREIAYQKYEVMINLLAICAGLEANPPSPTEPPKS